MTLLEMVQNILSALDSDEVNDINDTLEAIQVAEVIKETFFEQFNNIETPSSRSLIKLDALSDVNSPNYLEYNEDLKDIHWIKYKNDRANGKFETVCYVTPEEFLEICLSYTSTTDNVFLTTDPISGVQYYIKNNRAPAYYTCFDETYLAFDSYDVTYDATLQSSKTIVYGTKHPAFSMTNDFTPPIPHNLFPLLLAEAKSTCFLNLKQVASSKEEQRARRQRIRMQNDQFKSREQQWRHINNGPNFARVPR
jgi:hypothetical protein